MKLIVRHAEMPAEPLYLAGSLPELGRWHPRGVLLHPVDPVTHITELPLPAGTWFEFLLTRGTWRSAELDHAGRVHPPRTAISEPGSQLEETVSFGLRQSIQYHHDFPSRFLPHARSLIVFLPPGYEHDTHERYPVLYLQDGQNLFDAQTAFAGVPWGADETTEIAIRRGEVRPVILVGVANSPERIREYAPRRCGPAQADDLSRQYGRFLVEEVKPFIEQQYRVDGRSSVTGVGGSSLGGLIALSLCKWYPGVFGKCAAMSPSLWWQREYFLRTLRTNPLWLKTCQVWLDMGGREGATRLGMRANIARARALAKLLGKQMPEGRWHYYEDEIGGHDERAWGTRFEGMLKFLYPPST
jgi:predicted alpha/beta superfamily hydrolase